MPRYQINYTETVSDYVFMNADDEDAAEAAFYDALPFDTMIDEITEVPDK